MPEMLPKTKRQRRKEYIANYNKEYIRYKSVVFNLKIPEDVDMMKWLEERPQGISSYVKVLIMKDMKEHGERV